MKSPHRLYSSITALFFTGFYLVNNYELYSITKIHMKIQFKTATIKMTT
jgi:hypothetical protein